MSGAEYSPGSNIDFYTLGLLLLGLSTTVGGLNFIVTIMRMRAPGMSISRMPLFVWGVLFTSFVMIFAIPALSAANLLLSVDRQLGGRVFDPAGGGKPVLWQHLFWIFGHPDVYLIFLPAVAMVSTIVPVMCRRAIAGYTWLVLASGAIAVISFGVWVHHMFSTGLPAESQSFFSAASTVIAIPSGIQIFAWLATMWVGRPRWRAPLLYVAGFLVTFTIGGVTGVMFAMVPFDQQVTDSYFVVAHFHYVLVGGAVLPLFAGLHFWFPKFTGRMLSHRMAVIEFILVFVGLNLTFFPMHFLGLGGMPRRIQTYDAASGWGPANLISSLGAVVLVAGVGTFVVNAVLASRRGAAAGDDPWGADTLEWATTSPPAAENFARIPVVRSRHPLWDRGEYQTTFAELPGRTTPATHPLTGAPRAVIDIVTDSHAPLALALTLTAGMIGILVAATWSVVVGVIASLLAGAWWHLDRHHPEAAP